MDARRPVPFFQLTGSFFCSFLFYIHLFIYLLWFCVCGYRGSVFMWVQVCTMLTHMCVYHTFGGPEVNLSGIVCPPWCLFKREVSHYPKVHRIGYPQVPEIRLPYCLSPGIISMLSRAWLFFTEFRCSCFHGKYFKDWAFSPNLDFIAQATLETTVIYSPQPLKYWGCEHEPPCLPLLLFSCIYSKNQAQVSIL